jgi:deazaflavin-dependent oxidoreductase (nitroreductase family)
MSSATISMTDAIRRFNKHLLNPAMMHLAGRKYWYASVIRHTGRRSGRHYATPVVADRVNGGFIVPLPYGTGVDWLRNVEASGIAAITWRGHTYDVAEPEIVDAATAGVQLPARNRRIFQRFGIKNFLKVKVAQ